MSQPYPPYPPYPPHPQGYPPLQTPQYPPYPQYPQYSQYPQRGVGESLYDDAASLGRFWSYVIFGFIIFIAIIILISGISKSFSNSVYTETVLATVTNTNCTPIKTQQGDIITYKCNVSVKYEIEGKTYEIPSVMTDHQSIINQGQKLTLYYNPSNPNDVSSTSRSQEKQTGAGLIMTSIVMVALASLFLWMALKFKFFAAIQGGSFVRNIIR